MSHITEFLFETFSTVICRIESTGRNFSSFYFMSDGSLVILEAFLIWINVRCVVGSIFFCCCSNFR